jgi:hypothetical protein
MHGTGKKRLTVQRGCSMDYPGTQYSAGFGQISLIKSGIFVLDDPASWNEKGHGESRYTR